MNCGQTVDKQQTSECKQLKLQEKHENTFYDPHVNDGVMTPRADRNEAEDNISLNIWLCSVNDHV